MALGRGYHAPDSGVNRQAARILLVQQRNIIWPADPLRVVIPHLDDPHLSLATTISFPSLEENHTGFAETSVRLNGEASRFKAPNEPFAQTVFALTRHQYETAARFERGRSDLAEVLQRSIVNLVGKCNDVSAARIKTNRS